MLPVKSKLLYFPQIVALVSSRRGPTSRQAIYRALGRYKISPASVGLDGRDLYRRQDALYLADHLRRANAGKVA